MTFSLLNSMQLGNTLWSIADDLRGAMNANDFQDYMLSFLFLRVEQDHFRGITKMVLFNAAQPTP